MKFLEPEAKDFCPGSLDRYREKVRDWDPGTWRTQQLREMKEEKPCGGKRGGMKVQRSTFRNSRKKEIWDVCSC